MPFQSKRSATFEFDKNEPLARAKPESQLANTCLRDFAGMAGMRSVYRLHAQYAQLRVNNPHVRYPALATMLSWSSLYAWNARVACYDDIVRRREEDEFVKRRVQSRENRIGALNVALGRSARYLQFADPKAAVGLADVPDDELTAEHKMLLASSAIQALPTVAAILRLAIQELRSEFGDEPERDLNVSIRAEGGVIPMITRVVVTRPQGDVIDAEVDPQPGIAEIAPPTAPQNGQAHDEE